MPVSSSGHLRLIPEFFGVEPPDLATSAVLHLGTLGAVLGYYRRDILWIARGLRSDPKARRMVMMIVIASIPAVVAGFVFNDQLDRIQESADYVGLALIVTGVVLLVSGKVPRRDRTAEDVGIKVADVETIGSGCSGRRRLDSGL